MPWHNKSEWALSESGTRRSGFTKVGSQGDRHLPFPYFAVHGQFPTDTVRYPDPHYGYINGPNPDVPNLRFFYVVESSGVPFPYARNRAWSKLVDKVRQGPASLGVALAEAREACGMVAKRFSQCYQAYSALRKGNFRKFLKELGIRAKRRHRNLRKSLPSDASSLWLEYSFGWSPLFQDVYDGINAIGQPIPGGRFKATGREGFSFSSYYEEFSTNGRCLMGAFVEIDNPNSYLAQQMGLANPIQVAWELVPFSFVVDWVFDVGTCIGALTDFFGCEVSDGFTTYSAKANVTAIQPNGPSYDPGPTLTMSGHCAVVHRTLGLDFPYPNLNILSNLGTSIKRAANAAALLGQILTK